MVVTIPSILSNSRRNNEADFDLYLDLVAMELKTTITISAAIVLGNSIDCRLSVTARLRFSFFHLSVRIVPGLSES